MKPRICVWFRGYSGVIWGCYTCSSWVYMGNTPKEAYKKWALIEGVLDDPKC